jgi:hypothetical protein
MHPLFARPELARQIQNLVAEFTARWKEKGSINMADEDMISVHLAGG